MIGARVDTRQIDRAAEESAAPRVIASVARALKRPMREDQKAHARDREGSDGPWAPRKKILARGKKALRRNRRRLLGRLPRALVVTAAGNRVTAASRVAWSLIHQDGGTAGRGSRIPAREFLWISDGLMTAAAEALRDAAIAGWTGRG